MIKLENITLLDKKANSEPINFKVEDKITYLPYENKAIYNLLSIRQQYIKDGVLEINDFSLFPLKDQKKYAFVLNINSQVIVLNAVFVLELSFKDKTRGLLKKELASLRDMPLETDTDKTNKINQIILALLKFGCCYILVDQNDKTNMANFDLIKSCLENNDLTSIVLGLKPQPIPEVVKEEVKLDEAAPVIEEAPQEEAKQDKHTDAIINPADEVIKAKPALSPAEQILADQYRNEDEEEEFVTITRSMPIVTDEMYKKDLEDFEKEFEDFNLDIAYKKASDKTEEEIKSGKKKARKGIKSDSKALVFLKILYKHLYLYFLFTALFAVFLSVCSYSSVYLIGHDNKLIGGILVFLDIVFVFMHMYIIGSTYAGLRSKLQNIKQKAVFVISYILFTIIGFGVGMGFLAILSSNGIFVKLNEYLMTDWLLGIIVSVFGVVAPIACSPLAFIYVKVHDLIEKFFPHKLEDE